MRAAYIQNYGDTSTLRVGELPDPVVGPDYVRVRVEAAGVNPVDTKIRAGKLDGAFPSAFPLVLGWDVAGVVEQVGPSVTEYSVGDEVIGYVRKDHVQHGTYAELVTAAPRHLAPKPSSVGFAAAAGMPLAGLTALQALDAGQVGSGDVVLVNASAGGVGGFAAQLAVARGARVLGTASEGNHEYLRGLGVEPLTYGDGLAERVRALAGGPVDAALDLVGGEALAVSFDVVTDAGRVVSIIDAAKVREGGGRYVFVRPDAHQLAVLSRIVDAGELRVEVAGTFDLADVAKAHALVEEGHVRGKVVLTL